MITVRSRTNDNFFTIDHVGAHSPILVFRTHTGEAFAEYDNASEIKRLANVLMTGYNEPSCSLVIDRVERLYLFENAGVSISYEDGDILSDKLFSFVKEFEHENSDETTVSGFISRWRNDNTLTVEE